MNFFYGVPCWNIHLETVILVFCVCQKDFYLEDYTRTLFSGIAVKFVTVVSNQVSEALTYKQIRIQLNESKI